ncbi:MAG: holo-ACP synthase [Erysipelotrichaceae bacterium]
MISGVGVDIQNLSSFDITDDKFIERVLSENELMIYNQINNDKRKLEFLAGRFCAKEAIFKAYGKQQKGCFLEIEILMDEAGRPVANDEHIKVSIAHSNDNAISFATYEK